MTSYLECPHCGGGIEIQDKDINCAIFRHGIYKSGVMINPHESKINCEFLIKTEAIYGCGKPFKYLPKEKKLIICEYI